MPLRAPFSKPHKLKMSKIISLQAENIKRLKAVQITPKGHIVVVGGQNEQGKSSLLDSIAMALGGKNEIPDVPVRTGEAKAFVILETEDIVVKRTFTATGGTSLVVENKEGMRFQSPQDALNKLTDKVTFDPVAFTRLDRKAQALALKNLVKLDFTALDAERKKLYDERTSQNAIVTRTKVQAEQHVHFPDAPAEPVSTADLVAELDKASKHNAQLFALETAAGNADEAATEIQNALTDTNKELGLAEAKVAKLKEALAGLNLKAKAATEKLAEANKAVSEFVPIDSASISANLSDAGTINSQVNANAQRKAKLAELEAEKKKADDLTTKIEAIDKQKGEQLAAAKFPVPGLSFDDTGVLYNGLPLDQASGAAKLRVSVAIAAAMNPKLRVMIVRDGSLMDDASMELLGKLAAEYDIQCWVERVGSDKHVQVIIEDGSVLAPAEDNTAPLPLGDA
jgi:hypothetical protein